MNFDVDAFPINNLYKLLRNIIENTNFNTFDELSSELVGRCQLNITSYDDISVISTPSLSPSLKHMNKLVDNVVHSVKVCVIDKRTLLPIVYLNKTQNYFDICSTDTIDTYEYLEQRDTIKIYKNYIGESVTMFSHNNEWMLLIKNKLYKIDSEYLIVSIFKQTLEDKIDINKLNTDIVYEFMLLHYRLNKPVTYPQWGEDFEEILYINSTEKYTMKPFLIDVPNKFINNNRLYFSCFDEMNVYLEGLHKNDKQYKKLTIQGLVFTYMQDGDIYKILLNTRIYDEISKYFKDLENIHKTHLYIYQKDKCGDILTYVTNNPHTIIRRINISLNTLAKEILNIYFLTRNKQNEELYDILPKCYRDCLFNIHKIFISKRERDIINKDSDGLMEKRSVTVDNVYCYLKSIATDTLTTIYQVRKDLLHNIKNLSLSKDDIMYESCINTMLQSKLMDCSDHIDYAN
jgi:hypothetical protein